MVGHGQFDVPAGTWSDDSSLSLCLAESLCKGYDLSEIGNNFVKWYYEGYWTPHGKCLMLVLPRQEQYPICKVDVNQNWQEWIENEITVTDHL